MESQSLTALYDFENRQRVFPDVDGRFKFCILAFGGKEIKTKAADFVFFAHAVEDLDDKKRHIALSKKDLALLNPNTRTCPIFRARRDAELTKEVYRNVPILIDRSRREGGNPWGVRFCRMFDQTNDAERFRTAEELAALGCMLEGNRWRKGKETYLPLYEAKMIQAYDHRAAGVVVEAGNWVRQGQTEATTPALHQNPEFVVQPRWWVGEEAVATALEGRLRDAYLCYKDVTSATNQRTMIGAMIPRVAVVNSAPLMITGEDITPPRTCCLLANLNSLALDFVARQKVGGVHLNYFIVEQLPIFAPDRYAEKCPWDKRTTLEALDRGAGFEADVYGARHAAAGRGGGHGPAAAQVECGRARGTNGRVGRRLLSPLWNASRGRAIHSRHVSRLESGRRVRCGPLPQQRRDFGGLRPFAGRQVTPAASEDREKENGRKEDGRKEDEY